MANGHGGRRRGAGRKKNQVREIRDKALAEAGADAEYALGLFVDSMRNDLLPIDFRTACAKEVMDRVWGRSTQHNTSDVNMTAQFDIVEWTKEREQRRADITQIDDTEDNADPNG